MISKPETEGWLGKYSHNQFENYQIEEYNSALKYVKNFRTSLDLGANLGIMSARMVKDFKMVHAFEPLFYDHLQKNVKTDNIKIYPHAVGEKQKTVTMRIGHYHSGGSNIVDHLAIGKDYKNVQVVTIDSYDIPDVDFIKIDVEGYEWNAIQGAKKTIKNNEPVLLVELKQNNKNYNDIIYFFKNLNYNYKSVGEIDTVFYK
jgi:FkbM family methyltransferase